MVLDLYARLFDAEPLGPGDYVVCSNTNTNRGGSLAYLAAWDVHRGKVRQRQPRLLDRGQRLVTPRPSIHRPHDHTMAPSIETQAHVDGWAKVADAVHEDGGRIVMQVMHGGRESHSELTGTGRVVAPSAITGPERKS